MSKSTACWRGCGTSGHLGTAYYLGPLTTGRYWCWVQEGSFSLRCSCRKVMYIKGTGWRPGDWVIPLVWLDED